MGRWNAFVAHLCVEAFLVGRVAHVLDSAVRKKNVVLAAGYAVVPVLNVTEVVSGVEVTNSIAEGVSFRVLREKGREY